MINLTSKHTRVLKFLLSGGAAALTEYGSFILLSVLHMPAVVAQPISFCCGLIVSYLCNKFWVFAGDSTRQLHREVVQFAALATFNLCVTTGLMELFTNEMHIQKFLAKIVIMGLVACWNYLLFSRFIFRASTSKVE